MSDARPVHAVRPAPTAVVVDAARAWRAARDQRRPVQPAIHLALVPHGCEMLAPVFDSVLSLGETCLDRTLCTGCPLAPSADELMLCRLIDDPAELGRLDRCGRHGVEARDGVAQAFRCALVSARILLDQAATERAAA